MQELYEIIQSLPLWGGCQVYGEGGAQVPHRAQWEDFPGSEADPPQGGEAAMKFIHDDFVLACEFWSLAEIRLVLGVSRAGQGHGGQPVS